MNAIEKDFFLRNKIDLENCIDVEGSRLHDYVKIWMEVKELKYAFNTFPCKRGHTIKNSKGTCVICNSAAISYHSRERESGFIYIAGTKWGKKMKIGCTSNYEKREKYLNENKGYGFHADWKILAIMKVDQMGLRERQVQDELERYREYGIQYYRGKDIRESNEAFRCNYEKTLLILKTFGEKNNFLLKVIEKDTSTYNFKNLVKDENK